MVLYERELASQVSGRPREIKKMSLKQFWRALNMKRLVEVYQVIVLNVKQRKSQRQRDKVSTERGLKGPDELGSDVAFAKLIERQAKKPELVKSLQKNRSIFQTKLPNRVPPA